MRTIKTGKIWSVIHTDENDNTVFQKDFPAYDKPAIRDTINDRARLTKPGHEVTYGVTCDKFAFTTLFEVANIDGKLKRLLINSTVNFGKPVYKPFNYFQ